MDKFVGRSKFQKVTRFMAFLERQKYSIEAQIDGFQGLGVEKGVSIQGHHVLFECVCIIICVCVMYVL